MTDFKLSESIKHGGETIDKVTIRDLNTGDIRRIGEPTVVQQSRADPEMVSLVVDHSKLAQYVGAMTKLPIDAIDLLHPNDYMALAGKVQDFFGAIQTPKA